METEKVNITVSGDKENPTVTILKGEYKHPEEKHKLKSLAIAGSISTVSHFLETKKELITKNKVLIIVDTEKGIVSAQTDFDNSLGHKVQGQINDNQDILDLGINQEKSYGLKQLISALKFKKTKFAREEEFTKLINDLMSFNMKVDLEINKQNDQKGQINDSFVQNLKSNLKLDFLMNVPVFKDGEKKQFKVEILIELKDTRTTAFFMESYELNDLQILERERLLNEELDKLSEYTIVKQ